MNLPIEQMVLVGVIAFLLGLIIGGVLYSKRLFKRRRVGTLLINDKDPETSSYSFVLDGIALEELPKKSYVSLKIKVEEK